MTSSKVKNVHQQRERDRANGVKHFRVRCSGTEFKVLKAVVKAGGFADNGDATVSLFYSKAKELGIDVVNPPEIGALPMPKGKVKGGECASPFCSQRGARSPSRTVGQEQYLCQRCATSENEKQIVSGGSPNYVVVQDQRR